MAQMRCPEAQKIKCCDGASRFFLSYFILFFLRTIWENRTNRDKVCLEMSDFD